MRSSRQIRRNGKAERPFARRVGYETVKEGSGNLVQQAAMGLGALMGLLSSRWGMPATASVITGAIIGNAVGSIGKGFVAATVDHLRERREQPTAGQISGGGDRSGSGVASGKGGPGINGLRTRRGAPGTNSAGRGRLAAGGGSGGIAGQVISGIEQVIEQIDQAASKLGAVAANMRNSQDAMMVLLYGGRVDVVRQTHDTLSTARGKVEDSAVLLRGASEDLGAYRASI